MSSVSFSYHRGWETLPFVYPLSCSCFLTTKPHSSAVSKGSPRNIVLALERVCLSCRNLNLLMAYRSLTAFVLLPALPFHSSNEGPLPRKSQRILRKRNTDLSGSSKETFLRLRSKLTFSHQKVTEGHRRLLFRDLLSFMCLLSVSFWYPSISYPRHNIFSISLVPG